jgi:ABC-2 type transport system ATP-binding protein
MLATLLPPTSGEGRVCGFDVVRQAAAVRRAIGYVPQLLSAEGMLSGYENLLIFAKLYDIPRAGRAERIAEALEFMGLSEAAHRLVRTYSGGMIRRLEIAQSMLHRPQVLFLDEPTVGLDPLARQAVWQRIQSLSRDYQMTILLTTHYMEEADQLCGRLAIMQRAKVMALGSPQELKAVLGKGEVSLEEVFAYYAGTTLETGGNYLETSRRRRTIRRLH